MHLRRLDSVDQTQPIAPQELIDYEKPNFFASTSSSSTEGTTPPKEKDIDSGSNGNANHGGGGGGAKATSTGVAVGLVAFLYILMMICKSRSRREFSGSGQRSIHHRGNKRKIAPAPAQNTEPPAHRPNDAVTDNNNGENDIPDTNRSVHGNANANANANANPIDEEQPQLREQEEQHYNGDENIESSTVTAIALGALPTIPE